MAAEAVDDVHQPIVMHDVLDPLQELPVPDILKVGFTLQPVHHWTQHRTMVTNTFSPVGSNYEKASLVGEHVPTLNTARDNGEMVNISGNFLRASISLNCVLLIIMERHR